MSKGERFVKIGNVELNTKIVLAPMAGVTDVAFRTVCRELSGCYTVTEMVSAKALCYGDKKTSSLLTLGEGEHPCAVQIFGSDEAAMEKGAALALEQSGADIIDINMGCPVPKIAGSGDGSALMKDPEKAARVAAAVVRGAAGKPVTVKFRLGWDKGSINCVEFARRMEDVGVAAVAVHGQPMSSAPAPRCTLAPPTGTISGRSSRPYPSRWWPTGTFFPPKTPCGPCLTPVRTW